MTQNEHMARRARATYWTALGQPDRGGQEPAAASLEGWKAVVAQIRTEEREAERRLAAAIAASPAINTWDLT